MTTNTNQSDQSRIIRLVAAALIVLSCVWVLKSAASFGFSKILSRYSLATNSLAAANEAVKLTPNDAEAHRARAVVLNNSGMKEDAVKAIETAVSLRPKDDLLWMEVGMMRDGNSDADSALVAFDNSVRLAPHYGHPHWQRGNLLVRLGRYNEGFSDLRLAATSNRDFLPGLIDLAWGISRENVQLTEQLVEFHDDQTRLALSRFFARRKKNAEALQQFRKIAAPITEDARADLVRTLLQSNGFPEAFEIWKTGSANSNSTTIIQDGGFEGELVLDQGGFGWQAPKYDQVSFVLDVNDPHSGARSLRVTFEGYDNNAPVLSQLFLVKPERSYRVSFGVKTRDLVTGGLPVLKIVDATTNQALSSSSSFQSGTSGWTILNIDFKAGRTSTAVLLRLERNACSSSPCPVFGYVWLDSFAVEEVRVN